MSRRLDFEAPLTLADLVAALPGACLLIGYVVAMFINIAAPEVSVEFDENIAKYHQVSILVPQPHPEWERPKTFRPYILSIPELDVHGRPVITAQHRVLVGRGQPVITQNITEVILPVVSNPPLRVFKYGVYSVPERDLNGRMIGFPVLEYYGLRYEPSVSRHGTGVYQIRKNVRFNPQNDPEKWSVIAGVVGSLFSVAYLLYRLILPPHAASNSNGTTAG